MPLALVTGTSRHEFAKIMPAALKRLFAVIVTGDAVERGKPHPGPYRKALARLGVCPRRALVIENAPFGIRSARRAGTCCVALETSRTRRDLAGADRIVPSFDVLKALAPFAALRAAGRTGGGR